MSTTICMDFILVATLILAQGNRKRITLKVATGVLAKNKNKEDTR